MDSILSKNKTNFIKQGKVGKVSLAFMRLTRCISSMLAKVSLANLTTRIRKLSLACVIIGTPGDGESTKPLSHATKTSLDQQFSERRPEFASRVWAHYTSPNFLSSGLFDGSTGFLSGVFGMLATPAIAKAVSA